jgi:hypothetical protein
MRDCIRIIDMRLIQRDFRFLSDIALKFAMNAIQLTQSFVSIIETQFFMHRSESLVSKKTIYISLCTFELMKSMSENVISLIDKRIEEIFIAIMLFV